MVFKKGIGFWTGKKRGHPWNYNKKETREEVLLKQSESHKGQHSSPDTEFKKTLQLKNKPSYLAHKAFEKYYGISWKEMHKPIDAVLHHINGNNMDNCFENLCIMSRSDHALIHQKEVI